MAKRHGPTPKRGSNRADHQPTGRYTAAAPRRPRGRIQVVTVPIPTPAAPDGYVSDLTAYEGRRMSASGVVHRSYRSARTGNERRSCGGASADMERVANTVEVTCKNCLRSDPFDFVPVEPDPLG